MNHHIDDNTMSTDYLQQDHKTDENDILFEDNTNNAIQDHVPNTNANVEMKFDETHSIETKTGHNEDNEEKLTERSFPRQEQSQHDASQDDHNLTDAERIACLTDFNNELKDQVQELTQQLQAARQYINSTQTLPNTTAMDITPQRLTYGNASSSSSSSTASASIGNLQDYQTHRESDYEQELANARRDRLEAEQESLSFSLLVDNFMLTNNSLWIIIMNIVVMLQKDHNNTLLQNGRQHLKILEASGRYIYTRMQVKQLTSIPPPPTQKVDWLLKKVITSVSTINTILEDTQDGSTLPDLPRALKRRSLILADLSQLCNNAISDPNNATSNSNTILAIKARMEFLTKKIGEDLHEFANNHKFAHP